eukprot:4952813-Pleurochrysis_carterae.AAC.2
MKRRKISGQSHDVTLLSCAWARGRYVCAAAACYEHANVPGAGTRRRRGRAVETSRIRKPHTQQRCLSALAANASSERKAAWKNKTVRT